MLIPGSIVMQSKTMVNKKNFNDNKENRLSIVLFSYINHDNLYYCTVPLTNLNGGKYKSLNSKSHCYIPYTVFNDIKLCCAKIDSAYVYPESMVTSTGLNLDMNILERIYFKIMSLDVEDYQVELYRFIKINIKDSIDRYKYNLKKEKKKLEKERKERRKLQKLNYKK